ncbi:MAG: SDR family oxidoreductase [Rhodospirillaceae bacterium]
MSAPPAPRPVTLITGASRGIGAACATAFAAAGHDLLLTYNGSPEAAEITRKACLEAAPSSKIKVVQCDVAEERQILALYATLDADFGHLDVLVNNAGIVGPIGKLESFSAERMDHMLRVNVLGSLLCAREAVKRMSTAQDGAGGSIVNISSIAARIGSPFEFIDYAASKGAVDSFTLGLSKEVAPEGIRVNAVRPGLIETDIHASAGAPDRPDRLAPSVPLRRSGGAQEVAEAVLWLASPAASYVTGTLLDVGGGR